MGAPSGEGRRRIGHHGGDFKPRKKEKGRKEKEKEEEKEKKRRKKDSPQ